MITSDLKKYSMSLISTSITDVEIKGLISIFDDFLLLSKDIKHVTHYSLDKNNKSYDLGFYEQYRSNSNQSILTKEIFQYNDYYDDYYIKTKLNTFNSIENMICGMKYIFLKMKNIFLENILKELEYAYPNISKKFISKNGEKLKAMSLRLVKYKEVLSGEYIIIPHYDRGACTFILGENIPGLRTFHYKNGVETVAERFASPQQAVFMSGLNLEEITNGEINPLWHDAIQKYNPETLVIQPRIAIIFFVDTINNKLFEHDKERFLNKKIEKLCISYP